MPDGVVVVVAYGVIFAVVGEDAAPAADDEAVVDGFALVAVAMPYAAVVVKDRVAVGTSRGYLAFSPPETPIHRH